MVQWLSGSQQEVLSTLLARSREMVMMRHVRASHVIWILSITIRSVIVDVFVGVQTGNLSRVFPCASEDCRCVCMKQGVEVKKIK